MSYLAQVLQEQPQSSPIFGRTADMVMNNAGGYVFPVDDMTRLQRFLILGSEGGTYYAKEQTLTLENAEHVLELVKTRGLDVINTLLTVQENNRAPRISPTLFTLAMATAYGDTETRRLAMFYLPRIARTGSHLLQFVDYVDKMRGWGRLLKGGISDWYLSKNALNVTYQVLKYRNRNNWTHRDLLRKAHPKTDQVSINDVFGYIVSGVVSPQDNLPALTHEAGQLIHAFNTVQNPSTPLETVLGYIKSYNLTWEFLPTQLLNEPKVWETMLPKLPMTALLRNLNRLTNLGLLTPLTQHTNDTVLRLTDPQTVTRSRVHPFNVLVTLATYQEGRGFRGGLTWEPTPAIIEALEQTFELAFNNVTPTNKNFYIAVDVSGSMTAPMMNTNVTAQQASAALALITARTEPNHHLAFFSTGEPGDLSTDSHNWWNRNNWGTTPHMEQLPLNTRSSFKEVVNILNPKLPWGGTDCAIPMLDAAEKKMDVDCFIVLTDNETWAGKIHPTQALQQYRKKMNKPEAKLVVVGMTATKFSIADPDDAGMLDIVGFDTAMPTIINDFVSH